MIQKAQQFHHITKALTYLDNMLSGASIDWTAEVSQEMVSKLASLFDYCLKKKTTTKHPKYVYSAFNCFKQHKTHIQLNLTYASGYNKEMRDLIMHSMEEATNKKREEGDFSNLFRAELLQIFPTVKTMTIDECWNVYTFSLSRLFRLISKSALEKVVVRGGTWLTQQTTDQLKQTYQTAGYHINIDKDKQYPNGVEYSECVISKKKK